MMKFIAFLVSAAMLFQITALPVYGKEKEDDFVIPKGEEAVYNLNIDWKFKKPAAAFPLADAVSSELKDGKSFYDIDYDDSDWETVSVPHAVNACDSFDSLIADAGEAGLYRGFMFYRKEFVLPEKDAGKKVIIEFEAVRQSVYLYVNGTLAGYYEAGTAPIGFDITDFVRAGESNVIAVATDNAAYRGAAFTTKETIPGHEPGDCSGVGYQWNQKDFNEVQGGITGNVNLYVSSKLYQTRPLYNNLKTTGNYIYADGFDISGKSAVINVRAEIRNETGAECDASLLVYVVDGGGKLAAEFSSPVVKIAAAKDSGAVFETVVPSDAYEAEPTPTNAETVDVAYITASARAENLNFWSPDEPYLYDVYTAVESGGRIIDVQKTTTGLRKVDFDIDKGGLLINDKPFYLKGYAQRSTNEWAVIGVANDWMTDFDMRLVRESGADFIRWMHVSPKPAAIRSGDKYGVVSVCPAGDKEGDQSGRCWAQRVEAMRDAVIYFRNSPSVIFYEAGNAAITAEHMRQMTEMKKLLDPDGGRYMGCRSLTSPEQIAQAEWVGTMVYRYDSAAKAAMNKIGRQMPIVETEYKRDEAPRRVWDDFSPPDYDYVNKWLGDGAKKTDGYDIWDLNQEEMSVTLANEGDGYGYFYNNRVGGSTGNDYYSAAAMMVWSDSNMHGRNSGSENCRTSGRVDPVRIKKECFYAVRAMQSDSAEIHIVGHWNYPENTDENYSYFEKEWNGTYFEYTDKKLRRDPTKKTVYVIGSELCDKVELYINGALAGVCDNPRDTFVYEFPDIDVTRSGCVSAIAYSTEGKVIARDKTETAGEPYAIRLTPVTGPEGLRADGSDICYIDVEIVDEKGRVCPLAYDKISFSFEGEGTFLGGYNSGTYDETSVIHKDYCFAECGTNRVFVRSSGNAGSFKLTASVEGLPTAEVTVDSNAFETVGGLAAAPQQAYDKNIFYTEEKNTPFDKLVAENIASATVRKRTTESKRYIIKNADSGKALAANGENQLVTADMTEESPEFIWNLKFSESDICSITNSVTKLAADVPGLSKEEGKGLIVYASNSGDNQRWILKSDENGLFTITSKSSGLCMDSAGGAVVQSKYDGSSRQKWQLIEVAERDEYKVIVNGEEVRFKEKPYRPDSSSGVLCEIRPVLDALGAEYTYQTEGVLPEKLRDFSFPILTLSSGAVIVCGETAIRYGDESNLTNAEFYAEDGELIAEIAPVLGYIADVNVITDAETKTVTITTK
ncbi:MAG: RICIN domain-containing protein [Clostridia bacterium]